MRDGYRSERWAAFRRELIELDGAACVKCGRTAAEGAVLQVHHKRYLAGRKPWEYPIELCETLCRRCHAAEHGEIPPVGGWLFEGEEDLGGLYGNCDLCGQEIRHAFYVTHPDWSPLVVGTDCCDILTGTTVAADIRKSANRLKRFKASPRWEEFSGCLFITQKGIRVQISPCEGGCSVTMKETKGKAVYPDIDSAKAKVFDVIESGKAEDFFRKRKRS